MPNDDCPEQATERLCSVRELRTKWSIMLSRDRIRELQWTCRFPQPMRLRTGKLLYRETEIIDWIISGLQLAVTVDHHLRRSGVLRPRAAEVVEVVADACVTIDDDVARLLYRSGAPPVTDQLWRVRLRRNADSGVSVADGDDAASEDGVVAVLTHLGCQDVESTGDGGARARVPIAWAELARRRGSFRLAHKQFQIEINRQ